MTHIYASGKQKMQLRTNFFCPSRPLRKKALLRPHLLRFPPAPTRILTKKRFRTIIKQVKKLN
ncbi:MAG: hypothetical protein BHW58_06365 [Azospirillum sp. 51_20]|nr:MAG: hypothetical protein BHW58_06365 [Azospirillum sp. 51_20]